MVGKAMIINYHKTFIKQFKKLDKNMKQRVMERISLLIKNPFDSRLKNHGLVGELKGLRAISINGDIRLIFFGKK